MILSNLLKLHLMTYWAIGLMSRVFANCPGDRGSIPRRPGFKDSKNGT